MPIDKFGRSRDFGYKKLKRYVDELNHASVQEFRVALYTIEVKLNNLRKEVNKLKDKIATLEREFHEGIRKFEKLEHDLLNEKPISPNPIE